MMGLSGHNPTVSQGASVYAIFQGEMRSDEAGFAKGVQVLGLCKRVKVYIPLNSHPQQGLK